MMTGIKLAGRLTDAKLWRDTLIAQLARADSLTEWVHDNLALVIECELEIALLQHAEKLVHDGLEPWQAMRAACRDMTRGLLECPAHDILDCAFDTLKREAIIRLVRRYCGEAKSILLEHDIEDDADV